MPSAEPRNPVVAVWSLLGVVLASWAGAFGFGVGAGGTVAGVARDLGLPALEAWLVLLAPFVAVALLAAPLGWLVGRRWPNAVAVVGMVFLAIGLVVAALAPSALVIGVARAVSGMGAGATLGALTALLRRFSPGGRGVAVTCAVLGMLVAGAVGWLAATMVSSFRVALQIGILPTFPAGLVAAVIGVLSLVRRH